MDDFVKQAETKKTASVTKKKKKQASPKVAMIAAGLVVAVSLISAGVFYKQAQDAKGETLGAQQERNQEESARVIGKLESVLFIDQEDKPTVARVDNADELRKANEDFYKNAQNGDFLILYPQRAILFREEGSQIINVAPIINTANLQQDGGAAAPANVQTGPSEAPATEAGQ